MGIKLRKNTSSDLTVGWNAVFNIITLIYAIICILPVMLVYITSFTPEKSIARHGFKFIPERLTLDAYKFYLKSGEQIVDSYLVTVVVAVTGTLLSLFLISMIAYTLTRKDFKYRNAIAFYLFFTMLFNGGLVPSYVINSSVLRLNDTLLALILPHAVSAWYIMILRTFISTSIPFEIVESAKIDGAGEFRTYATIILPLSKPGLATIGLFTVIGYWNEWFLALLYINNPKLVPIQAMLMRIQRSLDFIQENSRYLNSAEAAELVGNLPTESGRMALTVIVMTPILFAYPFFQKYFIKGLTLGGVKG